MKAAEDAGVRTFVACGGLGELKTTAEPGAPYVYEGLVSTFSWIKPVTETHLAVKDIAFGSKIPIVFQIAPGGMSAGELTGAFKPVPDVVSEGAMAISYEDFAAVLLQALATKEAFNRKVVGAGKA